MTPSNPTPRLSFCIATLNRAAFIGETLDTILGDISDNVEIVIVDGASTDNTTQVVAGRFRDRPNCHYHRLEKKGGSDQDYAIAVGLCRGDFVWLMTDDDLLTPGAIQTVLENLRDEPDLLIVNATIETIDMGRVLIPKKMRLEATRDFGPGDGSGVMALAGDLLTFIGAVVIRRSVWMERDAKPYIGSWFVHVGVIFQRSMVGFVRVLAEPLVRIRYGNAQWTAKAFEIWMFKWPELIWSFPDISEDAKRAVVEREPWKSFRQHVQLKAKGNFTWEIYRSQLAHRPMPAGTRLLATLLARFPETLFNFLMSVGVAPLLLRGTTVWYELEMSPFNFRKRWLGR